MKLNGRNVTPQSPVEIKIQTREMARIPLNFTHNGSLTDDCCKYRFRSFNNERAKGQACDLFRRASSRRLPIGIA